MFSCGERPRGTQYVDSRRIGFHSIPLSTSLREQNWHACNRLGSDSFALTVLIPLDEKNSQHSLCKSSNFGKPEYCTRPWPETGEWATCREEKAEEGTNV